MGQGTSMIIMMVVLFAFMYFGMMRPQKKQQQKRQEMLSGVKKGDKIITIGGLHGMVDSIDQEAGTVDIDVDGVFLTFNLSAIRTVNPTAPAAPATPTEAPKADDAASSDDADDKGYSEGDDDNK
ncbi:preprotein translocase subunit YajC [Lacticaseibacillus absianus]|uniref:preprotein translocase subunit YajC n=1 Tax=Lacticaseibacillus absianus TaxID=2729623 RepID=UPI0015CDBA7B